MATTKEKKIIKAELKRLAHVRDKLNELYLAADIMGCDNLANRLSRATVLLAQGEGEIEQAVFGARDAAALWREPETPRQVKARLTKRAKGQAVRAERVRGHALGTLKNPTK